MADQGAAFEIERVTKEATSLSRRVADEKRLKEIQDLRVEMLKALESKDQAKLDLVNARLSELIAQEGKEKKAFVDTLKGLRDAGKSLGVEITVAEEQTPAEKAALAAAEQAVEEAQKAYDAIVAKPPMFFAQRRTETSEAALATAQSKLESVEHANARAAAARLDAIDIEEASKRLIGVSTNAQQAIQSRRTVIAAEIESAQSEIARVQAADQDLAARLDQLKDEVVRTDQARSDAKVDLDRETPGTEAFSLQAQKLQATEDAYKTAVNERDSTMEVRNQVQLNLEYTKTHLIGQRDIATALEVFQKTMEEQLSGLVVQYKSRVEAARALADLKFGSDVHATGNAVMSNMADYMAKASAAAQAEVTDMAEAQPEAIRAARATLEEQAEAAAATQARIDAVFADMERNYERDEAA